MNNLILYYFPECPYCIKVLRFIDDNNLNDYFIFKNIHKDPSFKEELIIKGGKEQVPCLLINEKPLYESSDIIEWIRNDLL